MSRWACLHTPYHPLPLEGLGLMLQNSAVVGADNSLDVAGFLCLDFLEYHWQCGSHSDHQ